MILSRPQIEEAVARQEIKFDPPLEKRQWGEASIDLRLGLKFTRIKAAPGVTLSMAKGIGVLSNSGLWTEKTLKVKDEFDKPEVYKLNAGEFILAQTYERIWIPNHLIALIEGAARMLVLVCRCTKPLHGFNQDGTVRLRLRYEIATQSTSS